MFVFLRVRVRLLYCELHVQNCWQFKIFSSQRIVVILTYFFTIKGLLLAKLLIDFYNPLCTYYAFLKGSVSTSSIGEQNLYEILKFLVGSRNSSVNLSVGWIFNGYCSVVLFIALSYLLSFKMELFWKYEEYKKRFSKKFL